jgi:single-strand DNA-binding protein
MSHINRVILVGNLGADPEFKETKDDMQIASFSIATAEKWNDPSGGKKERVEWHRIVVFGRAAEACRDYLQKGSKCLVEGKLQTKSWEDKDGQKKWSTEIIASNVEFLSAPAAAPTERRPLHQSKPVPKSRSYGRQSNARF